MTTLHGDSLILTESAPRLGKFNDRASSVRVISGKWRLYQDVHYQSSYHTTSGKPEFYNTIPGITSDTISSVKFLPEPYRNTPYS